MTENQRVSTACGDRRVGTVVARLAARIMDTATRASGSALYPAPALEQSFQRMRRQSTRERAPGCVTDFRERFSLWPRVSACNYLRQQRLAKHVLALASLGTIAPVRLTVPPPPPPGSFAFRTTPVAETFDVGMLRVQRFGPTHRVEPRRAVVLIPGLFCGSWIWNREIDSLASHYDVYAVALPGFDDRPVGAAEDSTQLMQRAANDLAHLVDARKLGHPIIVGHSLGGTLAVLFGATHPSDAGAIIAVEGGYPIALTVTERAARVSASTAPYEQATRATVGDSARLHMLRYVITNPADVDSVTKYASRSDPRAVVTWMRAALSLDLTSQLAAIRAPLLEIVPFDSDIDPYQGFRTLADKHVAYTTWVAHAPHGSVEMINHSRHFVMLDQAATFDAALLHAIRYYAGTAAGRVGWRFESRIRPW